jgi:predicted peptidase
MRARAIGVATLLVLATGCGMAKRRATADVAGTMVSRAVEVDGVRYPYQVYVPAVRGRARPPVILFLHGSGERGSDGVKQTTVGIGPAVRRRASDFPAVVVMPQAPADSVWAGPPARAAIAALDSAMAEFRGDPRRVYLTGISMGGFGTWEIALANPTRFAALVPICGGLRPISTQPNIAVRAVANTSGDIYDAAATTLARIPTWIFHGGADRLVPVEGSREMANALRRAGGNVQYTEYAGVGHNSWDPAYAESTLWPWLFAQRRPR